MEAVFGHDESVWHAAIGSSNSGMITKCCSGYSGVKKCCSRCLRMGRGLQPGTNDFSMALEL